MMFNRGIRILLLGGALLFSGIGLERLHAPNPWGLSKEERGWLDLFFKRMLLEESAIYTLAGSKPITSFPLFYPCVSGQTPPTREELWDKWEKIQNRFHISKKFLLVKREWSDDSKTFFPECTAIYEVHFINVYQTAFVIQENYELFKGVLGFDFDALQLVLDFEKDPLRFWKKINTPKYCHLWGLLYGFGKKNAYSYLWKNRHMTGLEQSPEEKLMSSDIKVRFTNTQPLPWDLHEYSISHFHLPIFASYSQDDPVVKKYEEERDQIKRLYRGKNFVNYTLELLTSSPTALKKGNF